MTTQRDALIRLLAEDDDPHTVALIKGQLIGRGHEALPELRQWIVEAPAEAVRHLRDVIAKIEAAEADGIFEDFCAHCGQDGDLEEAAWKLAATFLAGEDFAGQRRALDEWGGEVARRLKKAESPVDEIETLVEFLAHDVGLRGNEADYYNINNSLLPEIVDTRLGIPITLSLVYILVGRRAGISISGAGLPGHFLIRHGQQFFDPFNGGRRVGLDECRERLASLNLALTPGHLEPIKPPQFLTRMLANIHSIAVDRDPALAVKVLRWIDLLKPAVI
ncbi:conserved hypothetical protein [Chthoniobacter flavus Ellin428]|uniref:Protein SirB1 N-terminal domain-containing protein n=1 Tax=Chthoniobacter flavus Ellin428 TaxID=497964 RepID=B4D4B4_9BACT|nr:transglutaminase-like domain-containing protein [Chthoniobacter flavus]EDY18715.1 conserved hypothetical protein [Chthoniobacter flavus Ellin428]TCO89045.1 transglutaminase superfamily protein [Chthoniobacter flavus]